jgi:hypothetical protein
MNGVYQYGAIQLINQDFKDAKYFRADGRILVVVKDRIMTCHLGEAGRWIWEKRRGPGSEMTRVLAIDPAFNY